RLPVIFYPGLQEVRDDGRRVTSLGQMDGSLALEVGPGRHELEVRFVGARWGNWVSALAWVAVMVFGAVALVRRWRRRRVVQAGKAAFPAGAALAGAALMIVPVWLPAARVSLKRRAAERTMGLALVSSEAFPGARPLNAFDGDPQTEWVTI